MGSYDKIFTPLQLTPKLTLKNRIIKSPASTWRWNEDGTADDSDGIYLYEAEAKGGVGGMVIASILWEPAGTGIYLSAFDDKFIPGMKQLTDTLHKYDVVVVGQLHHMGPSAWGTYDGGLPVGPSDLSEEEIPTPPPFGRAVRGLSIDEIHDKQQKMISAAVRLQKGGFDGVQVHAAHGYFLNSWMSPIWNHRDDEYGCQNVENRTRIIREVIQGIREQCGPDFFISTRINGQEFSPDRQGITQEMAVENAKALEAAGAQAISISCYGYGPLSFRYLPDYFPYPEPESHMVKEMGRYNGLGLIDEPAHKIKDAVNVPVVTAGRIDEDKAEEILENGHADIIGINRQLWADPEFVNKIKAGCPQDVRRCTRCASCEDPVTQPRYCRVNPSLGQERELAIEPVDDPKNVMVIGGGPAGMEAALTLDARGHKVTLFEKSGVLGGRIKLAEMIKYGGCEDVLPIYDHLTREMEKSGVTVKLKTEVTPELVKKVHPDAVVIANSSPYYVPDVPGINGRNVFTIPAMSKMAQKPLQMFGPEKLSKMSEKIFPVGKKIVVIGAGAEGVQCAIFLMKRGKEVVLVAEGEDIGGLVPLKYKERLVPWFNLKNTRIERNAKLESVDRKSVAIKKQDGSIEEIPCDSVMVMLPERRDPMLFDQIKAVVPATYEVGSTLGGENSFLKHAIGDGRRIGVAI